MAAVDERANLRHLGDMEVVAVAELGRKKMRLKQVRQLRKGDVIPLERLAGEAFSIKVNGAPFAEGEIVVVSEQMAGRLTRMVEVPAVEEEGEEEEEEEAESESIAETLPKELPEEGNVADSVRARNEREMTRIPESSFTMGSSVEEGAPGERPAHTVYLDSYYIDKYPVTNEQYREFTLETGYRSPPHWRRGNYALGMDEHPVVNVSWRDALTYAEWAGKRLPTEAEWELAARGTDERCYPWGNRFVAGERCNCINMIGTTTPVDEFPDGRSPYGIWDMAGNTFEWCADYYDEDYYEISPDVDPRGPEGGQERAVRSGCFVETRAAVRVAFREGVREDETSEYIGFRCAMDA